MKTIAINPENWVHDSIDIKIDRENGVLEIWDRKYKLVHQGVAGDGEFDCYKVYEFGDIAHTKKEWENFLNRIESGEENAHYTAGKFYDDKKYMAMRTQYAGMQEFVRESEDPFIAIAKLIAFFG